MEALPGVGEIQSQLQKLWDDVLLISCVKLASARARRLNGLAFQTACGGKLFRMGQPLLFSDTEEQRKAWQAPCTA